MDCLAKKAGASYDGRPVSVDSLNVPKSTSRRFRHFKHLLRSLLEVKKKNDSLKESNKRVLYGFYTNNVLVRRP
jgi:hypothetical protein